MLSPFGIQAAKQVRHFEAITPNPAFERDSPEAGCPSIQTTWTPPITQQVLNVDSVLDCGSTYGLFAGIALALMKMRGVQVSFVSRP